MPSFLTTPGPIHLFVRGRANQTGLYLGTCVTAPEPEITYEKIPVINDLGGRSVPFQLVQDGSRALVIATLNRFDIVVCQALRSVAGGGAPLGQETGFARGTLVIGVNDFELICTNGYAGNPASSNAALPLGRRYFSSSLMKYKESTVGTRVLEVAMAFQCDNVFDPITRGFGLYTEAILGPLAAIT